MSSTIVLDAVSKTYANGVRAVDSVSLAVEAGEFVVLVGPSGCGKSTLLRMVAGLEDLTDGRIIIGDKDVSDVPPKHRDVAMVFQSYALFPHMTVAQNIGFGLRMRRFAKDDTEKRVQEAARILELTHLLDRRPAALSGGQRQRVAMGRALVRDARAFLMDEPLSNLDAQLRGVMRMELRQMHERVKGTTLYVTHDQVEALTLGDRVAVLRDGHLQQCASPHEIFTRPANVFVAAFIGSPAMNLMQGTHVDGSVHVADVTVPVMNRRHGTAEVVLGLRPAAFEDAEFAREEGLCRMRVVPSAVEDLGDEKHVVFSIDAPAVIPSELRADDGVARRSAVITARVHPRSSARTGEAMDVTFDPREAHLFDPESGKAMDA
ncbi:MAG: ABC transporter ATP-binding protein [Candidatus Limnocylindria bacterium]